MSKYQAEELDQDIDEILIPDSLLTTDGKPLEEIKKKKKKKAPKILDVDDEIVIDDKDILENLMELSFEERLYLSLERFRKKCKFGPKRMSIFSSYLSYGKVSAGHKPYINSKIKDPEIEPELQRGIDEPEIKQVDFLYSIYLYLTDCFIINGRYVDLLSFESVSFVIKRFLNYLISSKTCPEYLDDIKESLKLLNKTEIQLPAVKNLMLNFPCKINRSLSLFYEGELSWLKKSKYAKEDDIIEAIGMSIEESENILKGLFGELGMWLKSKKVSAKMRIEEVKEIEGREYAILSMEEQDPKDSTKLDPYYCSNSANILQENENMILQSSNPFIPLLFDIYIESKLVQYCIPRSIIDGDFIELSNGVYFCDNVYRILPPFCADDLPI